jgi:hypothetical protein
VEKELDIDELERTDVERVMFRKTYFPRRQHHPEFFCNGKLSASWSGDAIQLDMAQLFVGLRVQSGLLTWPESGAVPR